MRIVLLTVMFIAIAQAWPRGRFNKGKSRWNNWVSKVEKDVSGQTETWSKWGSKLSNRLVEKESETVSIDSVDTTEAVVDDSKTDDELIDRKVWSKRGHSSDSDDNGSEDEDDKSSDSDDKKHDSDDKDIVIRSKVPGFDKDSDDLPNMDSSMIDFIKPRFGFPKFGEDSGEFEEKFGSKFELPRFGGEENDLLTKFRKFDGPTFGIEFEGRDSSMERKFGFPKFNDDDKNSGDDEDCEKDSSKHDSSIDFNFPPKFDLDNLKERISDFEGLERKFKSHGEDSSSDSEDKDNSDDNKPSFTGKRFDWRKFHPSPDSSSFLNKDVERKVKDDSSTDVEDTVVDTVDDKVVVDDIVEDKVVVDDVVEDTVVVDDVVDTVEDVQGEPLEVVIPEASRPCDNCGPSRRKL